MPTYEFKCTKCGTTFEVALPVAERDTRKVSCPSCQATEVERTVTGFYAKTSRKA